MHRSSPAFGKGADAECVAVRGQHRQALDQIGIQRLRIERMDKNDGADAIAARSMISGSDVDARRVELRVGK